MTTPSAAAPTELTVGVLRETADGERRAALDPAAVSKLVAAGRAVVIEAGAGTAAHFPDDAYTAAGATVARRIDVIARSDVIAVVRAPDAALVADLRPDQVLVGLLDPFNNLAAVRTLAARGTTLVALELLPRTLSRAQAMDALSSQSSAAGYRAAIVAAHAFGRYLPMMITASGAATPGRVMVIGTGVAGLQAIATSKRLGAVVTGYDVRPASRGEVESLGARFLTPSVADGAGTGGYARAMTADEQAAQQAELSDALVDFDVIITTAKVPGQIPPVLVPAATLAALRPGSVCVDLGSSDRGGNVAGSVPGTTITTPGGVTVVGAGELAADLPTSASQMYARNVTAVLGSIAPAGSIVIDPHDEVHRAIVVCRGGDVLNEAARSALGLDALPSPATPLEVAAA